MVSVADYDAMSKEICRRIEIVDGEIVECAPPFRAHQRVLRRLADALEADVPDHLAVVHNVDLRLRDEPLLNRRPDIAVYDASLPDDEVLRPQNCVLLVEVMSPDSVVVDQIEKPVEYARAGIPHFWRVEYDDNLSTTIYRYQLDSTGGYYLTA